MNLDTHQPVYREHLLEHLLMAELLKYSWLNYGAKPEVSQPEVDRAPSRPQFQRGSGRCPPIRLYR